MQQQNARIQVIYPIRPGGTAVSGAADRIGNDGMTTILPPRTDKN